MDVVSAAFVLERGVHLLDIEAAIGVLIVTVVARGARPLAMLQMTRETAQAFVNADRSAVVP